MDPLNECDVLFCFYMFVAGLTFGAVLFVNLSIWPMMLFLCIMFLMCAYGAFMENPARDE